MFPHLTMVMYNSASSTIDAPRWRAVIPTTCAMTIDVHRDILIAIHEGPQPPRLLFEEATGEAGATGLSVASCMGLIRPSSQHALSSTCRCRQPLGQMRRSS